MPYTQPATMQQIVPKPEPASLHEPVLELEEIVPSNQRNVSIFEEVEEGMSTGKVVVLVHMA